MLNKDNRANKKAGSIKRNEIIVKADRLSKTIKMRKTKGITGFSTILIALIFLFITLTGCGASRMKSDSTAVESAPQADASADKANYSNSFGGSIGGSSSYQSQARAVYGDEDTGNKEDIRKVIKSGEIAVEVKEVESAYSKIMEIVRDVGGEEFSKSFSVSGDFKRMEIVLKIPPENLDLFEQKLTEYVGEGKIKRSNIRSRDITSEYYDYVARLESYKASRDQLRELLKKAQTVEEILKIHAELTRIQADIDSMQGQINMWDKLIDMATITLYIDEESNPMKMTRTVGWQFNSPEEIWSTMKNGFITVVNGLYSVIIWILIAIVSISPILLLAGIVIYVVYYLKRKRKKKESNTLQ